MGVVRLKVGKIADGIAKPARVSQIRVIFARSKTYRNVEVGNANAADDIVKIKS